MFSAGLLTAACAQAFQISGFSPQGEVSQVRQLVVKFDEAAVNFGDPKAAAPLSISCSDAGASKGNGRWVNEREWAFEFSNDLPPGVRCNVQIKAGLQSNKGVNFAGNSSYQFNTGGPFVRNILPSYGAIDEEQYFIAQLNGPATLASVQANMWCQVDGLGERLPVKLIDGKERTELLKSQGFEQPAAAEPLRFVTFSCNRRLTPSAKLQVVFGKGVATPSQVLNTIEKRFNFTVREPFTASFNCERENAQAACLPLRPLTLSFNTPVPRKLAAAIKLVSSKETFKPNFDAEEGDDATVVSVVNFKGTSGGGGILPESTQFTLEVPKDLKDASGRSLRNMDSFPLKVATGAMPPLAKFAASTFGVLERFAEPSGTPLLPVTLRNVENKLSVKTLAVGGKVSDLQPKTDAEIIDWFQKVKRYDSYSVSRIVAAKEVKSGLPPKLVKNPKAEAGEDREDDGTRVQTRMVSLLTGQAGVKTLDLPQPVGAQASRPFEVVGIPLTPGFHVLEIASQNLGASLLDARYGANRIMYVRTSALVTNLGVHFKLGRENALAWVTTLDTGKPAANARVVVSDCRGKEVATAQTNAQGVASLKGVPPQPASCLNAGDSEDEYSEGRKAYFVSARTATADAAGVQDIAFTWSDWYKGMEPWRFNLPTSQELQPDDRLHTIFDRSLLRAGETVSMKHILRSQTSQGFGLSAAQPNVLEITHVGSGQKYSQTVTWRKTATGGQSAENTFTIPPAAKLGVYQVELKGGNERSFSSGQFRVEEFRLPVLEGRIQPADKKALVNVTSIATDVQINYVSGGPALNLPVSVSALVRSKSLSFADYDAFSFSSPQPIRKVGAGDEEEATSSQEQRVIADKLALKLDKNGAGKLVLDKVPASKKAQELLLEATYADPNGEVQTIRNVAALWPAGVIAGIKTEGWVSTSQQLKFQALALDLAGKAAAGVALDVKAIARITTSSRKRLVGGFYSYDNKTETKDLGSVCSGKSDARGLLLCETKLSEPGEVELVVTAKDTDGNTIQAASSVTVTKQGEIWFGGEDHDRMDVLPEKKAYQPGEVAKFQVRMPFRFATALVAVEREGIVETQVMQLNGQDPTISLTVKEGWGPNVYVSVLALRGRLREVPWYSLFTWGYKAPREWWTAFWYEGREYVAPTALVDLSKPAFRFGAAEIRVGTQAHQLNVSVKADKESYPVRGKAQVTIQVKLPNGQPAAHAEVALAAVDQALLELSQIGRAHV